MSIQNKDSSGRNLILQGRIVWLVGDLFAGEIKRDQNSKQPVLNPQTGQPVQHYGFGLAVPKALAGDMWTAMQAEIMELYPSGQIPRDFAYKFRDGDGLDHNGASFATREGYAGCLVFALTTRLPIKFFRYEGANNIQVSEGIKCGDYVNVQVGVKAHGGQKPGMYLNPLAVQLVRQGKEITASVNADSIFGQQAPQAPANYVADPGPSFPTQMQQAPQAPFGQATPGMPTPFQQPMQQVPQAPAQPHYGVLPQMHQPSMPQAAMPPMPNYGAPSAAPAPFSAPGVPLQQPPNFSQPGHPPMGQPNFGMPQQFGQAPVAPVMPQQPMAPNGFPAFPGQ